MDEAVIRPARPQDEAALGRLGGALLRQHHAEDPWRFLWVEHPERGYGRFLVSLIGEADDLVLVAERAGQVVGFAYASVEETSWKDLRPPCVYLHDLGVDEAARGAGLGERLVRAAWTWGAERGAPRMVLMRSAGNEAARRLFERLGFRPTMVEMTREIEGAVEPSRG